MHVHFILPQMYISYNSIMGGRDTKDEVADSEVDNKIQHMYNLFLLYVTSHDIDVLQEFLNTNYRMIDELYHSTYDKEEKDLFKQYTKLILNLNGS